MKSKTSYFNKSIFLKDMKSYWSLWMAEIFIALLVITFPVMAIKNNIVQSGINDTAQITDNIKKFLLSTTNIITNPVFIFVLSIVAAITIFQYLFNSRDLYMIHSLPIKRGCLFVSHYLAGFLIIIIPYIVGFITLFAANIAYQTHIASKLLFGLFQVITMIMLFYSLACGIVIMSGNTAISIVIYVVANILYIAAYFMISIVNTFFSYSMNEFTVVNVIKNKFAWLSPIVYLCDKTGIKGGNIKTGSMTVFTFVLMAGIAVFIIAFVLYKKRKSEAVGDTMAFSWCKAVFKSVFSILAGAYLAIIVFVIYFDNTSMTYHARQKYALALIVSVLIFTAICYFISEMIIKKTFMVFKNFSVVNLAVVLVIVFGSVMAAKTGLLEQKIPDAKDVALIEITNSQNLIAVTEKNEIEEYVKLCKKIEEEKPEIKDETCYVKYKYYLNNGSEVCVSYSLPEDENSILYDAEKIFAKSDKKAEEVFSRACADSNYNITDITISDGDKDMEVPTDSKFTKELYKALVKRHGRRKCEAV